MYWIKCLLPGTLAMGLENGSVALPPGKPYDIEQHCSRKWIENSAELKDYIRRGIISVVEDSNNAIAPPPIKKAVNMHVPQPLVAPVAVVVDIPGPVDVVEPPAVDTTPVVHTTPVQTPTPAAQAQVVVPAKPVVAVPEVVEEPVVEQEVVEHEIVDDLTGVTLKVYGKKEPKYKKTKLKAMSWAELKKLAKKEKINLRRKGRDKVTKELLAL